MMRSKVSFVRSFSTRINTIGIVGVGEMGEKIVKKLEEDKFKLFVYDKLTSNAKRVQSPNVIVMDSVEDMAKNCSVVLSILPNDTATKDVSERLLKNSLPTLCHISCSTVSPTTSRALAASYKERNATFISAPVFARPDGLFKRQSTWMISGDRKGRDIAHDLLSNLGKTVDYGDDVGAGNIVKLCGNFLIASSIESIAESMVLAEKHGVDRVEVMKLLSSTIFDCLIYKGYGQRVSERDHRPGGFSLELGLKDMTLVSQAAREVDAPMPFLSTLLDRYVSSKARGRGAMDWSAIGLAAAEDSGIDVKEDVQRNEENIRSGTKY